MAERARRAVLRSSPSHRQVSKLETFQTKHFNNKLFLVVKITEDFPQSKQITTYAKKISTSTVTCTTAEKALLLTEVTSMESAIATVTVSLVAIQEQIESKFWLGQVSGLSPLSLL